ncbi:unnamed protein product [Brachionus calyciflorus]|uniref:G-protein coupled receptors family 1 profile domain-containing protein n=1 Tax=Brachionus calyciflorus TaxID=104777 RepID=A0A814H3W7_9BILA|nr:unnamed protein product [Brachionus calyciflorus]
MPKLILFSLPGNAKSNDLFCVSRKVLKIQRVVLIQTSGLIPVLYFWLSFDNGMNIYAVEIFIDCLMFINISKICWMFGKIMCTVSGFLMYFIGCSSIYLLSAISFERWYVIMNPFKFRIFTRKSIIIMIIACELFSLFWCLAPLFGWSYYSMEISLTTCSIEWYENSFNVKSYNTVIFMLVYFIPLVFLIFTNCKIVFMIRSLNGFLKNSGEKFFSKKRVIKERKLTISILLVIIGFMISWTPYAVVSLIAVFFSEYIEISPMMSLMPAIFAKTSLFWPSALYIFSNRQIQVILAKKMSAFTKRKATSDIYMTTMNQLTRTICSRVGTPADDEAK